MYMCAHLYGHLCIHMYIRMSGCLAVGVAAAAAARRTTFGKCDKLSMGMGRG